MSSPYYGANFVTEALAKSSRIAQLDTGTDAFAAYSIYDHRGLVKKVLLINSSYYSSGNRSAQAFTLSSLSGRSVIAKRLTSAAATDRVDRGQNPTVSRVCHPVMTYG
jgi:hypothetical protein